MRISKKQRIVAQSSCEAEFVGMAFVLKEVMWIEELLDELGVIFMTSVIYCDNQGAIKIAENKSSSGRTKHISIRLELIKSKIQENKIILRYIKSEDNIADIFTKPLGRLKFNKLCEKIMSTQDQDQGGMLKLEDNKRTQKVHDKKGDLEPFSEDKRRS